MCECDRIAFKRLLIDSLKDHTYCSASRVAAAGHLSCCWSQQHRQNHNQPHLLVPPFLSMEHTRLSFVIHNATVCTSSDSFLPSILSTQSRSFNLFGSCYTYGMSNFWNISVISNQSVQNQLDSYKGVMLCLDDIDLIKLASILTGWSGLQAVYYSLLTHPDSYSCLQSHAV